MAHCWVLLTSGGQHKVMDSADQVAVQVRKALESSPAAPVQLNGLPGYVFPTHVVSVRPGDE